MKSRKKILSFILVLLSVCLMTTSLTACEENFQTMLDTTEQLIDALDKITSPDDEDETGEEESEPCEHDWSEWATLKAASCTEEGIQARACTLCLQMEQNPIEKLPHETETHAAKAPTCTEIGYNEYVTCKNCGYTTYEEISVTEHTYVNGICKDCDDIFVSEESKVWDNYLKYELNEDEQSYTVRIFVEEDLEDISSFEEFVATHSEVTSITAPLIIPSSYNDLPVTKIGARGFICLSFESVIIPNSVTSIGAWAFGYCINLENITIPNSVVSIGEASFSYCTNLKNLIISNSVTTIAEQAFIECVNLSNVILPRSITSIEKMAFAGCTNLENILIPDSITSMGYGAFLGCKNLKYNKYDNAYYLGNENNPYVILVETQNDEISACSIHKNTKIIGDFAFDSCTITSITIPDSVTSISSHAFYHCSTLASVTIPDSITSIGQKPFEGCDSLTNITFEGTIAQWNEIEKGEDWGNDNVPATKVICSDGEVAL